MVAGGQGRFAQFGRRFFTRQDGRWHITPLLLVVLVLESTDLLFAVDSVPAIFGISTDPYIVFTSNIFAILGLRALYFLLAGMLDRFCYLNYGLAAVLGFVGAKMIAQWWFAGNSQQPCDSRLGLLGGDYRLAGDSDPGLDHSHTVN